MLKLHEAIAVVLLDKPKRTASIEEIAAEINDRKLYQRKDGNPLPAYQVMQRAKLSKGRYHHLFDWIKPDSVIQKPIKTSAMKYFFPFGSKLKKVEQHPKERKKVFVLGVYASAVHAKWLDKEGKIKVRALAVASEPEIFWRGDRAEEIIKGINIPKELGALVAADERFNGPSGITLDERILKPLNYSRRDAWLCDILPYSRLNPSQEAALEKHYTGEIRRKHGLPDVTIPKFTLSELDNNERRNEILEELKVSGAETLVLLGDYPIRYFLSSFTNYRFKRLSDFGTTLKDYGKPHHIAIEGRTYNVIPLVHPRQAGNLGRSSKEWNQLHEQWIKSMMMTWC